MDKWKYSLFDDDLIVYPEFEDYANVQSAIDFFEDPASCSDKMVGFACTIRSSALQRSIVESLMIADDCVHDDIAEITGVPLAVISIYESLFFRVFDAFSSKIDLIDFVETGVAYYSEAEDEELLALFLLKRWTMSLGMEFILWKFRLQPIEYSADRLYTVITREAFFYHKEKSMGNIDIPIAEYLRSASILLNSVKNSTTIKSSSEQDAGLDMLDQLGIIIKEVAAPTIVLEDIKGIEFVNNALSQETT